MDRSSTLDVGVGEAAELMAKVAAGDTRAFDRFYDMFHPVLRRLFAVCDGHLISADDFVQEVFTRFWQQRRNFQGRSCLATYLLAIARHTLNEHSRHSRKIAPIPLKTPMGLASDSHNGLSDPEAELYLKELAAAVERARGRLTAKEQQALEISQVTDLALRKVSQGPNCSRAALRSRLKRARKRSLGLLAPVFAGASSSM